MAVIVGGNSCFRCTTRRNHIAILAMDCHRSCRVNYLRDVHWNRICGNYILGIACLVLHSDGCRVPLKSANLAGKRSERSGIQIEVSQPFDAVRNVVKCVNSNCMLLCNSASSLRLLLAILRNDLLLSGTLLY